VRLLHRYILLQLLLGAALAVGLFLLVLVAGSALRDINEYLASGRITWLTAARMVLTLMPYLIPYALPFGLLTAVLIVFGRLSASREITAMKAAGVSLGHIAAPVFFIAVLGTALAAIVNFSYAPRAKAGYRDLVANLLREDPLRFIQPKTHIREFPGVVFYAEEREEDAFTQMRLWELDEAHRALRYVEAKRGTIAFDEADQAVVLTLFNARVELRDADNPEDFSEPLAYGSTRRLDYRLRLDRLLGQRAGDAPKLSLLTFRELMGYRTRLHAAAGDADGAAALPGVASIPAELARVRLQIQENLALAFAVISLTAVGVPLGIKASRSETYANLGLALGLALAYYFIFIIIKLLEETPAARPDLLVWLPNLLFQGLGLALFIRAAKN